MTDPIADMLSRIRNAVTAKGTRVDMPASRLKAEIARILQDEGYIQGFKLLEGATEKTTAQTKTLRLFLKYGPHGERLITGVQRISRPGRRVYFGKEDVPEVLAGLGTSILTTSRGVMTGRAAVKAGVGGEVLCNIWETHMSRSGKKPISVPKGVTAKVVDGAVELQGPKGKLRQAHPAGINFELADGHLVAKCATDNPELGKFHGLARSLVANAVAGVTDGFKRELDIVGVGYRAEIKGKQVIFALGYSHAVVFDIPQGIDIAIDKQTHITVTGVDRQLVGQVAANIRRLRKPDPYKQKGVRYTGEVLKKKAGKTGAK